MQKFSYDKGQLPETPLFTEDEMFDFIKKWY